MIAAENFLRLAFSQAKEDGKENFAKNIFKLIEDVSKVNEKDKQDGKTQN